MTVAIYVLWSLWVGNTAVHGVQQHRVEKAAIQATACEKTPACADLARREKELAR